MLPSEVRPMNLKIEDPLVTGKNNKAKQIFPTRPKAMAEYSSFTSHLCNKNYSVTGNTYINII